MESIPHTGNSERMKKLSQSGAQYVEEVGKGPEHVRFCGLY